MPVTILLAMRSQVFCKCFTDFIEMKTGAAIIGSCDTEQDVKFLYEKLHPDILLMDIKLGKHYCFGLMESILQKDSDAKIIGITSYYQQDVEERLREIGAKGYMLRNDDIKIMEKMILEVMEGQTHFPEQLTC